MDLVLALEKGEWTTSGENAVFNKINSLTIKIQKFPVIIGREQHNGIPTIIIKNPYVSATHAMLLETDKNLGIMDQKSKNGTAIEREGTLTILEKTKIKSLRKDDKIILAPDIYDHTVIRVLTTTHCAEPEDEIVEKNLKLMIDKKEGGMANSIWSESIGGNAEFWNDIPCVALNFSYDQQTGEIIQFGNIQSIPKEIKTKYARGGFRLAWDFKQTGKLQIITLYGALPKTEKATEILAKTIEEYNKRYGFNPE